METIEEFVRRTRGPLVPFLPDRYPWAYAHHYLRGEAERLPAELGAVASPLSLAGARALIEAWSGMTGEPVEEAARLLADAYLRRWGIEAAQAATHTADPGETAVVVPARQRGTAKAGKSQRARVVRPAATAGTGETPAAGA